MRAADTNVIVRLITRDDVAQTASAEAFVTKGAWVSQLVLVETIWVLDSVFGLNHKQLVELGHVCLSAVSSVHQPASERTASESLAGCGAASALPGRSRRFRAGEAR